jgi:hypothetical protein
MRFQAEAGRRFHTAGPRQMGVNQRLWTVKLLCFFISRAMHSVRIPLRQIQAANK